MTRTTPELAPPLQTSTPHRREDVWPLRMNWRATGPIHGGSSVESGFEPGTLRPQSRDLTTRPPRPFIGQKNYIQCLNMDKIHVRTINAMENELFTGEKKNS
ncbi:hypothetical protein AVEN_115206-1 [Araneus ventricosus]|uniref:Uncharacterized protein n=1 Tax=Araneus ventricosus TaxID=182803 RepID=A0A4Y1ZY81_ARAVE|nr:hypothetical protein AVEN_115206-1 [Araneus ventricosus]